MINETVQSTGINVTPSPLGHKLEIGRHNFKDRILEDCIYVDKTPYIYQLINQDSQCFLSRPRRFGKSLLISTLKELFSGSKELFKNCCIYDQMDWQVYPVIHLDFLRVDYRTLGLERALDETMVSLATHFNLQLHRQSSKGKLAELIELLAKDKKIVILVDEYDKPIIDYLGNLPEAVKNRDTLKNFFSIFKSYTEKIRFLMITGVSKFSQVSIFSDLNHLSDITLDPRYSRLLGYTLAEIQHYFPTYIDQWEQQTGENRQILFEKLQDYYNGYSWDGVHFMYNPFSILSFFGTYQFDNYWFSTGTPTFLVNVLKNTDIMVSQYDRLSVNAHFFAKYDIQTIGADNISALLFQTGYLTIKEKNDQRYTLSYPNREVKTAFLHYLLEGFSNKPGYEANLITEQLREALAENNMDNFIQALQSLLSSIPYNMQVPHREAYYHSLIYIALKMSMAGVFAEIQTALGRSDIVVSLERCLYILEFKMGSAQSALDQILAKRYYAPYLGQNKKIILLGIGLQESERKIVDWKIQELGAEPQPAISHDAQMEKRRIAKQMLADNLPVEFIVKYSGLSEAEIKAL